MVVGDWHSKIHEEAISNALESLGHSVIRFPWYRYFSPHGTGLSAGIAASSARLQNKIVAGPLVTRLNQDMVTMSLSRQPEALFVYRGTHIESKFLEVIRTERPHTVIVGYNNDDPFSSKASRVLWRHFLRSIPSYDLMLAYRRGNIEDFRHAGALWVELFRSWFDEDVHKRLRLEPSDIERYGCDVVFAGHFEPDGRAQMLEAIAQAGFRLKIYGPEHDWDRTIRRSRALGFLGAVKPVLGESYGKAITGAKVALCFLSKLNRDTYTRRVFEITAFGSLLMSEYSDDLAALLKEDEDAVYFRSKEELVAKVRRYVLDDEGRNRIAASGYDRVHRDGHDVRSRARQLVKWITEAQMKNGRVELGMEGHG